MHLSMKHVLITGGIHRISPCLKAGVQRIPSAGLEQSFAAKIIGYRNTNLIHEFDGKYSPFI